MTSWVVVEHCIAFKVSQPVSGSVPAPGHPPPDDDELDDADALCDDAEPDACDAALLDALEPPVDPDDVTVAEDAAELAVLADEALAPVELADVPLLVPTDAALELDATVEVTVAVDDDVVSSVLDPVCVQPSAANNAMTTDRRDMGIPSTHALSARK